MKLTKILLLLFLFSCTAEKEKFVLVSKDPTNSYTSWLKSLNGELKVREFYTISKDSLDYFLSRADGIVMTGGEDVNPEVYGKPEFRDLCEEPDNYRDSIEMLMIRYAMKKGVPMIGICRGQQIINAVNGGTLIPDIPSKFPGSPIAHRSKSDSAHLISPMPASWIDKKFGSGGHWVNSRHHQAVFKVAPGFKIAAFSSDGIIESLELENNHAHPFILTVQWHPENLRDSLATAFGRMFLDKI